MLALMLALLLMLFVCLVLGAHDRIEVKQELGVCLPGASRKMAAPQMPPTLLLRVASPAARAAVDDVCEHHT